MPRAMRSKRQYRVPAQHQALHDMTGIQERYGDQTPKENWYLTNLWGLSLALSDTHLFAGTEAGRVWRLPLSDVSVQITDEIPDEKDSQMSGLSGKHWLTDEDRREICQRYKRHKREDKPPRD